MLLGLRFEKAESRTAFLNGFLTLLGLPVDCAMFFLNSLPSSLSVIQYFLSLLLSDNQTVTIQEQERLLLHTSKAKVSLPVDNPTQSFWTHGDRNANPLATEGSDGPLSENVDIAIIGSGITGISVAYHLSQSLHLLDFPVTIAVIEARNFCSGATGRNGGHLTPVIFEGFHQSEFQYGTNEALRFLDLENHTVNALLSFITQQKIAGDIDLVHGPHAKFLFSDEEKDRLDVDYEAANASHRADLTSVRFLSNTSTSIAYGPNYPSIEFSGNNVWPLKLVTELFKAARKTIQSTFGDSELILHTQTPVLDIIGLDPQQDTSGTPLPKQWRLKTPRGDINTHIIIHATNAYAGYLLPFLAPGESNRSITPTRGQVIATRASVPAYHFRKGNFDANNGFEYWFSRPVADPLIDKPLVILGGARDAAAPGYETGITDDSTINANVSKTLRGFLPRLYPKGWFAEDGEPEMEWTGIMGYTQSSSPVVGSVLDYYDGTFLNGQYISAGYTGHGMPRAYGCAEALVQMIISDIRQQQWTPPSWFPRSYLTDFAK